MNIIFFGTPDFALECLKKIYENKDHKILAVVTKKDMPNKRGKKIIFSPVKQFALENNFKIYQPEKVKNNNEFINDLIDLKPDIFVVVAYGKILPKNILDIPKCGCINVHGSLLPKYRGAAPIQRAVLNGEKETGITTMFMDEGMDTGDIIIQKSINIGEDETTGDVWQKLEILGSNVLDETLEKIEIEKNEIESKNIDNKEFLDLLKNSLHCKKQNNDAATYAKMIEKDEAKIDWNISTDKIHNKVRGLNPILGAYFTYNDNKIKLWKTKIIDTKDFENKFEINTSSRKNGEVLVSNIKKGLFVKTNNGVLQLLELQKENSKKMDWKNFLNGFKIEEESILN